MLRSFPQSHTGAQARAGKSPIIMLLLLAIVVAGTAFVVPYSRDKLFSLMGMNKPTLNSQYILKKAEKGPFRIMITENGTVDSMHNSVLSNKVEGSTTIISLVPEGSRVNAPTVAEFDGVVEFMDTQSESSKSIKLRGEDGKEKVYEITLGEFSEILVQDRQQVRKFDYISGDVVCELDSSTLAEKEKEQQIKVTTTKATVEKSAINIEIQETTNDSAVGTARSLEKLAELDLNMYISDGGEYDQEFATIEGDIKTNEEQLSMDMEAYDKVRSQARLGYKNVNELETARLAVTKSMIAKGVNLGKRKVLQDFMKERKIIELQQAADDSKKETLRAQKEGEATMTQLRAELEAANLTYSVELEKWKLFKRQITACRLVAPQAGEVVYASQNSSRGSEPVVIEEGAAVRERQAIINLPDLENMKIDARIHESKISKVVVGQPVEIEIDALPGESFRGVLATVASVPTPGSWPNTDLKEYITAVEIQDSLERVRKLKPGMNAECRIIVEDRKEPVLQIPIQSVISTSGHYFTFVVVANEAERRELRIGDANDEYMEILDGVAEGESVIMNPRTHFSKELSALESKLSTEAEANREKFDTPERRSGGQGAGGPGEVAGGGSERGPAAGNPGQGGGPGAGGGPGGPGGMQDPKARFESMDANKDGVVTKDEHPRPEFFDRSDKDGDGKITLEEMQKAAEERGQGKGKSP
ncbi:MAG: efflux RND transporter periplasmic adaptor subunit [Planctomycetota bacterium]|nr:efflux RND transporter periplasmic adaptor subunit [Planctomycetota bacterium]